jgi:class 3 adenylate cyclase
MREVNKEKLQNQMKLIVFWIRPTGEVIPRNQKACQLLRDIPSNNNLIHDLFHLEDYDQILNYAKSCKQKAIELPFKSGIEKTIIWEFVAGKDGVVSLSLDWRVIEQLLSNIEQGNYIFQEILLNILPEYIVDELVAKGSVQPKVYRHSTILFTDVVNFSKLSFNLDPVSLIRKLDSYFSMYDTVMDEYGIEKIKTIGDSYMCVSGLPIKKDSHAVDCCLAALKLLYSMFGNRKPENIVENLDLNNWSIRVGIHSGPCIAGVVGFKKYIFDIWGDSVNIAWQMQKTSIPGKINISEQTYHEVKDLFQCSFREKREITKIGKVNLYFLDRINPKLSMDKLGFYPNDEFKSAYYEKFIKKDNNYYLKALPVFIKSYMEVNT